MGGRGAALLFDLGDIGAQPPRKLLRILHVLVSGAHMDYFSGFDALQALAGWSLTMSGDR